MVTLKLMEAEKGVLRLDCVVEQFVKEHGSLSVLVNGKDCPVQETEWFSDETYFGRFTDRKGIHLQLSCRSPELGNGDTSVSFVPLQTDRSGQRFL